MNGARPNPPPVPGVQSIPARPAGAGHPQPAVHPAAPVPHNNGQHSHGQHAPAAHPHAPAAGGPKIAAPVAPPPVPEDLDAIELVDELMEEAAPATEKKIQYLGVVESGHQTRKWKRTPTANGTGASRVRSFHGKYSEQGLEYLDNAINDWLDNNPAIEVKFVTSTVMTFEGKIREPALVLNVWY